MLNPCRCFSAWITFVLLLVLSPAAQAQEIDADLLIVGGNEAGVAAALQAARSGVKRIALVSDTPWLGGQFSNEAVGAIDEWTIVDGKRVNFPRSGIFLEVIEQIRDHNLRRYGTATPGNAVTATDTIEPAAAAKILEGLLQPYVSPLGATIRLERRRRPVTVRIGANSARVTFESVEDGDRGPSLSVNARLLIDCTDWGDVIRLSGAEYFAGADPRSRFNEPSAPENPTASDRNEMNPISYCLVLREADTPEIIERPPHYDPRRYYGATNATRAQFDPLGWPKGVLYLNVPPFVDSAYLEGIYSKNQSVYTQRRLVDRHHNGLPAGSECILLNWVTQDYPLYHFPQWVVDALEETESGASRKNIVEMTYRQRQIAFDDAKRQSLGMLYFLQNLPDKAVAERFQRLRLVDDFGTSDRLPPKPYVREGLRLHALSMLREQDIRTPHAEPRWAKVMPHDALFGFQFNIDFHPTRRQFLNDDANAPWTLIHTPTRNWSTHTDRAMLSARSLAPIKAERLLGCSKNIGLTSITSAALRLHGQMMLTGQAAGALAAICLERNQTPRQVVADGRLIEQVQRQLVAGIDGKPGVLLWPYHDVPPEAPHFVAANLLTAWQILPPLPDSVYFQPDRPVTRREALTALARAAASLDRPGKSRPPQVAEADEVATTTEFVDWLKACNLEPKYPTPNRQLTRALLALILWDAIKDQPRWHPRDPDYLQPRHDADGDGIADLDDPLPFDRDNDGLPDRIDPDPIAP